jgi:penicillin-binding protein 1C
MLAATSPLSIVGVREDDQLRRPAASQELLRLKLSALGGNGRRWWFINGAPLGDSANQDSINATFDQLGRYQLSVLDEGGQTARVEFSVVD